jgi:DNA-binding winged helix-turn-helix (wHTH) protein
MPLIAAGLALGLAGANNEPVRRSSPKDLTGFSQESVGAYVRARFGRFVLDQDRRQLLLDSVAIHLTPKAYLLLAALVEASPRAVSKEELQQRLWPATFVDEANLTVLVSELRSALDDDPRQARYVRTVHGFGYAFAAEIQRDGRASDLRVAGSTDWWLLWSQGQIRLDGREHIVGRDAAASVRLDAGSVSRRHARLVLEDDSGMLEDLGSKNGTWVNGVQVSVVTPVQDGDELRFGSVTTRLRHAYAADSTETVGPR